MRPRPTPLLLVFARAPSEDARAKPLGVDQDRAAAVYEAMLTRTLEQARAVPGATVRLVTTECLVRAAQRGVEAEAQVAAPLSQRLEHAVAAGFARGHASVVCLCADTPGLDTVVLTRAVRALDEDRARAVIGPAPDGGYYLVGMNAAPHGALARVATGTIHTARDTAVSLIADFELHTLAPLADVDRSADLRRLLRHAPLALRRFLVHLVALLDE
ncbi:MAG: DUF2064 domain-containing protein, partial [Polyangia bacterium]